MEKFDIYKDIAKRTNGDIYVGVFGPVRTGKSTFVTKFIERLVIPNLDGKYQKAITTDEMPQSADGKTVMTTEPKFVPSQSVKIKLKNKSSVNVRLVDCVGYMVKGAIGDTEDGKPRMVKTPWNKTEIPFEKAAEIGTKKVISEHSTIGILVTTDGSFTDIPHENYEEAEEKCVKELKNINKPFVIVLNVKDPKSSESAKLRNRLEQKYSAPVILVNAESLSAEEINEILEKVLFEFPIKTIDVKLPKWMQALSPDCDIISGIIDEIKKCSCDMYKMKDFTLLTTAFENSEQVDCPEISDIKLDCGTAEYCVSAKDGLFYKILSAESGDQIDDEFELLDYIKGLSKAKREYNRLKNALDSVDQCGYGVVMPTNDQMELLQPEIIRQGSRFGVKLRATAPSLHLVRVDVKAEISPLVGSQQQGEDLITYLQGEYEKSKEEIWNTNLFGKSLKELVNVELESKVNSMPMEAKTKLKKTVTKIVNEGKGGIICILL